MSLIMNIKKKLADFSIEINIKAEGEILGILGASGSGKSMILKMISGIVTPDWGQIILNDRVLFDSEQKINIPVKDRRIGFLFQNYALFPHMTVEENIGFGLNKTDKSLRKKIINEKMEMLKLDGLSKRYPYELSGGQQQRVALARALAVSPEILILDEPFSALDSHLKTQIQRELMECLGGFKGVTLFVTHSMDEAYFLCKRIMVINEGRQTALNYKEKIFEAPPDYYSARITGCKNIAKAKKINRSSVEVPAWNCNLNIENSIDEQEFYVGIRANEIKISDNEKSLNKGGSDNVFPCFVAESIELPFRITLFLKAVKGEKEESWVNDLSYNFQVELPKYEWNKIKNKSGIIYACLNKEKIFSMPLI